MSDIVKVRVVSKENNSTKIIEASLDVTYEEFIAKFFEKLEIEPNLKDVTFYVVNFTGDPRGKTLRQLGVQNNSYFIYLDEKNYIGKSHILYQEDFDKLHKAIQFCQVPFFLEDVNSNSYLDTTKKCKKLPFNTIDKNNCCFPIIIIDQKYFNQTISYIKNCNKYFEYKNYPLLLNKLIMDSSSAIKNKYEITHIPNKKICGFFAEITDTENSDLFPDLEQKQKIINKIFNYEKFKHNFNEEIEKWSRLIFNLCAEYLQFTLNLKPIYFCCNNCKYPVLFLDELSNPDISTKQLIKKFYKKIDDQVDTYNKVLNLLNVDYLPNNTNEQKNLLKVNIIYYNSRFKDKENALRETIDEIELKIEGTIILSCHLESFQVILEELSSKIKEEENIKFELIVNGYSCAEVMEFIYTNQYNNLFNNVYIMSKSSNNPKLTQLMDKYKDLIRVILPSIKPIFEYIKNNNTKLSNPYKITKLINIQNYNYNYHFFHELIAKFYGKKINENFTNAYNKFDEFIHKQKSLQIRIDPSLTLEDQQNVLLLVVKKNFDADIDSLERIIYQIRTYTSELSFYRDFNYWLRELDPISFEAIAFFTADFMFSLNMYAEKFKKGLKENIDLYRGLKISFIELSLYKRNKGNIITFSNFFSTSTSEGATKIFSGLNRTCEEKKKENIFSLTYRIKYVYRDIYFPCSIDINDLSVYQSENERLFLPFSFFKILGCTIDYTERSAIVELEAIGKMEILELLINDKNIIIYNEKKNIMSVPSKILFTEFEGSALENIEDTDILSLKLDSYNTLVAKKISPLEQFNKLYRCKLNTKDKEIILKRRFINNNGFSLLNSVSFNRLSKLYLKNNSINNLEISGQFNNHFINEINLRSNRIVSINGFKYYCFKNLSILKLAKNKIKDISILENNNFNNLRYLDIAKNEIEDISVFKKAHFTELEKLRLENNPIINIEVLNEAIQLINLRELNFESSANIKYRIKDIKNCTSEVIELALSKIDFIQNYIFNNEITITTNIQNEKKYTLVDILEDCKCNKMKYVLDCNLFINAFKKTILYNVLDDEEREKIQNNIINDNFELNDTKILEFENEIEKTYSKKINILKMINYNVENNYFILNFNSSIFSTITKLNLSHNNINNLYIPSDRNLKSLITLNLSDNKIKDLSILKYTNFPYLTKLYLNNNEATSFDFNDLKNMQNLIELTLYKNKIKNIYNLDTAPLDNFKYLNLQVNELTEFIYKNSQKITSINLSNNSISKVEIKNNFLQYFDLDFNKIKDLNFFEKSYFPNLVNLHLRGNLVEDVKISNEIENKNLQFLDLSNNNISIFKDFKMQLIKLEKLFLGHNHITQLESLEYCHFESLQFLYLDHNDFSNIDKIKIPNDLRLIEIDLSFNKIQQFPLFKNVNLEKCRKLNLSNNLITDISILKNINSNVFNVLDLRFNKIEDISPLKNIDFSNNEQLLLSNNLITSIEPLRNKNFYGLRILDISNNKIQKINIINTMKFNNLKELKIKNNEFHDQDELKIIDFGDLDYIDIIVDPEKDQYKDFVLEPDEERFFHNEIFDFFNKKIYRLKGLYYFYFDRTNIINLSNNKIYSIHSLEFADLSTVSLINLSNNYIYNIFPLKSLNYEGKQCYLKSLDLSHNWIKSVEVFNEINIGVLEELKLNNNQIQDISPLYNIKPNLLVNLDLNDNKIAEIKINKNLDFDKLKTLKLMNNVIKTIEIQSLVDFLSIQNLFLNNNIIENIIINNIIDINLINIEKFDLSQNRLENIEFMKKIKNNNYIFKNRDSSYKILDFSSNKIKDVSAFKNVDLSNFSEIMLNNNRINEIGCLREHDLSELVKLDLRDNKIKNFDALATIKYNNIKQILIKNNPISNKRIFRNCDFHDLDYIDVFVNFDETDYEDLSNKSANEKLDYPSSDIYRLNGINQFNFSNITEIDLSNNKIYSIYSLKQIKLSNIRSLDLSRNMIYNIDALQGINNCNGTESQLKTLNLSSNWIKSLKIFNNLIINNLNLLYLNDNQIEEIEPLYNINEKDMITIDLSNNKIEKIEINQNFDFKKLNSLRLNNNYIYSIKITEEINFPSLENIYLNNNVISEIKLSDWVKIGYKIFYNLDMTQNKLKNIWYLDNIKMNFEDDTKEKEEKNKKYSTKNINISKNIIKKTKEINEKLERLSKNLKVNIII